MIAIIDYEMGNVLSVKNALERIGVASIITRDRVKIQKADGLILPGVGSAKGGMKNILKLDISTFIKEEIMKGKPLLGICLGMQLLMTKSEEGNVDCLDCIPGNVVRFKTNEKVPQVGWNTVEVSAKSRLFRGINDKSYFYFVHSYYSIPTDNTVISATTEYGTKFCCAIESKNIYGVQFHPEKSGVVGEMLLKNFIELSYENNTCN